MRSFSSLIVWLVVLLLFYCSHIYAQKNCPFRIDTSRILNNRNLNTFLHLFKTDSFVVKNKKKYIPHFIKKELKCLAGGFGIANPGRPYNAGDVIVRNLPMRQLVFLARSKNVFVMQYKRGGYASTNNLVFILHNGKQIVDLWKGSLNVVADCKSMKELSYYMDLSKQLKLQFQSYYLSF